MPTTEAKDRKAFIRVGISLAKKSIAKASQAESEQKKLRHHGEKGRWLHRLVRRLDLLLLISRDPIRRPDTSLSHKPPSCDFRHQSVSTDVYVVRLGCNGDPRGHPLCPRRT